MQRKIFLDRKFKPKGSSYVKYLLYAAVGLIFLVLLAPLITRERQEKVVSKRPVSEKGVVVREIPKPLTAASDRLPYDDSNSATEAQGPESVRGFDGEMVKDGMDETGKMAMSLEHRADDAAQNSPHGVEQASVDPKIPEGHQGGGQTADQERSDPFAAPGRLGDPASQSKTASLGESEGSFVGDRRLSKDGSSFPGGRQAGLEKPSLVAENRDAPPEVEHRRPDTASFAALGPESSMPTTTSSNTAPAGVLPKTPQTARTQPGTASIAPSKPVPGGGPMYAVRLGSFKEKENAEGLQKKLRDKGYNIHIRVTTHPSLGTLHVVQSAPVADAHEAGMLLTRIKKDANVNPMIIKVSAGQ